MVALRNYRPEARALLVLGVPLAGSHVAQVALGAIDTLMMGWYGVPELAAVTIATSFFFILMLACAGFAWAAMPLIAAAAEARDEQGIRRVTRMAFWLVTLFGALCLLPMWMSEPILLRLGQKAIVANLAQDYLRVAAVGIFPALWLMVLKSYLSALERTQVVLWSHVAVIPMNALINYLLIFGIGPFPELGVRGAALATVVVQATMVALLTAYVLRVFPQHQLFVRLWRSDPEVMARVFKLGWPIALTSVSEAGLFTATALIMGLIGTVELAAHGIAIQLASLTFVMHLGLSQAATVRAGRAVGRRSLPDLHQTGRVAIAMSITVAALTVAVFLTVPVPLLSIFLDPTEPQREAILALGAGLLAMAALFQLMDGAQVMALGLLRGVQDTQVPMYMAAGSYWLVGVPTSYLLGITFGLGPLAVWAGLVIGLALAGALLMWRFWWQTGQRLPA
ncbi:MAG: MATE family efflux transporter [Shimia sp.]